MPHLTIYYTYISTYLSHIEQVQQIANAVPLEVNNPRNSLASHFSFKRDFLQLEKIIHWKEAQNPLCPLFIEIREGSHQASPAPSRVPRPSEVNVTFVRLKNDLKCKIAATIFVCSKLISTSWFSSPSMRIWHNAQCFTSPLFCHFEKISRHPHQQWRTLPSPMTPISPLGQSSMLSENLIVPWLISLWAGHSLCPRNLYCPSCCCHHSCHIACIDITISLIMGLRTDKRAPTSSTIVTSVRFHPCTPPIIWKDMLGKSKVSPGSWFRSLETTF